MTNSLYIPTPSVSSPYLLLLLLHLHLSVSSLFLFPLSLFLSCIFSLFLSFSFSLSLHQTHVVSRARESDRGKKPGQNWTLAISLSFCSLHLFLRDNERERANLSSPDCTILFFFPLSLFFLKRQTGREAEEKSPTTCLTSEQTLPGSPSPPSQLFSSTSSPVSLSLFPALSSLLSFFLLLHFFFLS